jgi:regulator of sigma E protease
MIDESMDTEAMKEEPKPWEFRSKPTWQRLIIMLGGVTVNFILAVVIYIGMAWSYGDQYIPMDSLEGGILVTEKSIGDELGVQTGDKILAVDGDKVENFGALFLEIVNGNSITIERDGRVFDQAIPIDFIATLIEDEDKARFISIRQPFIIKEISKDSPNKGVDLQKGDKVISIGGEEMFYMDQAIPLLEKYAGQNIKLTVERAGGTVKDVDVKVTEDAKLGVALGALTMKEYEEMGILKVNTQKYTLLQAIPAGIDKGVTTLTSYVKQLKKIFNPETGAYKGVGGFAAIGSMFPDTWNWEIFWGTTALISIILAFMNILPIPALDGGHVMFLLYEMISGRKPSDKFLEYAQMVGFFLLIGLLLFANGNDVYKWLFK